MARPVKTGLNYFSLDVDFFSNFKIRRIIKANGPESPSVIIALLCSIYKTKGYYIILDDSLPFLISDEIGVSEELVLEVINTALQVNFFDFELAKKNVLTSSEIQSRWLKVCKDAKRSGFEILPHLNLIEKTFTPELIELTPEKTELTPEETQLTPEENTQRKVKESKEDKTIIKGDISESEFIDVWKRARLYYDKKKSGFDKLLQFERQNFNSLLNDFSKKEFEYAVAGLFFQDTVPAVRVRPEWLLKREHFEKMLDCWLNQTKIFDNKQAVTETQKFQKGDV